VQLIHLIDVVDCLIYYCMFYSHGYIHDDSVMFCDLVLLVSKQVGFCIDIRFRIDEWGLNATIMSGKVTMLKFDQQSFKNQLPSGALVVWITRLL